MIKLLVSSAFIVLTIACIPRKIVWMVASIFLVVLVIVGFTDNLIIVDLVYLGYLVSINSLSYYLVILSIWISVVIILSRLKIIKANEFGVWFNFFIIILIFILLLTFSTSHRLMFYFFFEASLIPTLIIIMGWGYQPERIQAGLYFLFYTLAASLPLLLTILFARLSSSSFIFYVWWGIKNFFTGDGRVIIFLGLRLSLAFLVKLPIFFVHLWLPKAHVEAPVAGSMILAGVLLKLGGYGLVCVAPALILCLSFVRGYLIGLSLAGMLFVGFICLRLNDFKALVAYSSVAHMGVVIGGIIRFFMWGFNGGVVIMLGHGLSSSGLFRIVNIYYERLGSRRFFINRGLMLLLPTFAFLIFILTASNIAAPPTINLLSEIFLMGRIIGFDLFMLLLFPLGSFIGVVFSLFIFSYSQHGKLYNMGYGVSLVSSREIHILLLHIIPVNFLILGCYFFLTTN